MPTPDETRREIEELRRRADQMEAEARRQEFVAAQMRRIAVEAEAAGIASLDLAEVERAIEALVSRGLPSTKESTNLDSMSSAQESSTPESRGLARGKGRVKGTKHPFVRALYARGLTVSAWAVANGVPKATAASWIATGPAARRITREWADKIAKLYGVPATVATWRNGITD